MDFATFKSETIGFLWRVGDTELDAAMPKLVRTAENRMQVDLKYTDDDKTLVTQVTTHPEFPLPTDADSITSVMFEEEGPGVYITPHDFSRATRREPLVPGAIYVDRNAVNQFNYTVQGRVLLHRWDAASVEHPIGIILVYTPFPASLIDDDDTIYNAYTAMYEACVYNEVLEYLLEAERAAAYDAKYKTRLDEARFDQSNRKFVGGPLRMQMPRRDVS